ncbi:glutathione S-transferase [Colwellia sp. MB02u-10]|uniref:glutathione S-transferase n=1 Tax=Colwellia sp. MB02u-10 TaxID=2759828 RepID=UPI0015F378D5|nr:glutathione S-transferase [Colwellia sp. MB02u-10]MBA6341570.1 glutathione S-transferase [Colwellia sp. MB02u-10]
MKIYDVEGFPNPLRVRMALAEKNALDLVTFVPVDVMNAEHRSDAFLVKNPAAGVPVLELDDGTYISECSAIIEYIDHTFAGISLTGTSAKERAVISMMQRRAEFMVLDAAATYFHHATDGLGPDLEIDQNKAWGNKQAKNVLAGFKYFNTVLSNAPFVAGDEFTMADITLFAGLAFADFGKLTVPSQYTHLLAWRAKIQDRPSLK